MTRIVAILFALAQLPAFALPMIAVQQSVQYEPRRLSGPATNMVLYLMPNSPENTLNGTGVSSLKDFSGWGHFVTNGTAASQPVLTRSDNKGNLLKQSEAFSTTWSLIRFNAFGATDTGEFNAGSFANTSRITDPSGGNTADFVQDDETASSTHSMRQISVLLSDGAYTASVFAQSAGITWVKLIFQNAAGTSGVVQYVNLSDGSLGAGVENGAYGTYTGSGITSVNAGNNWWRVGCRIDNVIAGSHMLIIQTATGNNSGSYSGNNTSGLFLWGASLRPASWDTNYIATVATPAFAGVNGFRSLYFDGTDDYLKSAAFTWNQPETIFMGVKQWTWTVNDTLFDGNASSSARFYQSATTPNVRLTAGTPNTEVTTMGLGTNYLATVLFNGASSSVQVNNGSATVSDAGAGNAGGFTLVALGTPANYGNVQSGRVLGFNRVLTANELAYVRWGEAARLGVKLW